MIRSELPYPSLTIRGALAETEGEHPIPETQQGSTNKLLQRGSCDSDPGN